MRRNGFISLILAAIFMLANPSHSAAEPELWADSAILMDAKTGEVLFEKEAHKARHPASLTKIMTGILAIEHGNLEEIVTITPRAANVDVGQNIKLRAGQKVTLGDLLNAALMYSANDAAVAIAEHVGGTEEIFLRMMNQKALALGAVNTHFVNANGYSKPNHLTTAYDLALITKYAMENETFSKIVRTPSTTITKIDNGTLELKNINKILKLYPDATGVKTGTTSAAGNCLAATASRNDKNLIAIALKSGKTKRYQDCIKLFDYGFNEFEKINLYKKGELWDEIFIPSGKPDSLKIFLEKEVTFNLTKEQLSKLEKKLTLNRHPNFPIEKGAKLGSITFYLEGKEIETVNLVAGNSVVEKNFWNSIIP